MVALANLLTANAVNKASLEHKWGGILNLRRYKMLRYRMDYAAAARNGQATVLVARTILTQLAVDVPFITIHSLVDYGTDSTNRE